MSELDRLIAELCPDGVEFVPLCDIAIISNGKDHKALLDGEIPVYGSGGIMRYANQFIYDKESVLIPRKGSIGNIFYVVNPFWTVDTIFYTKIDIDKIIPKFFYYYLEAQHLEDLNMAGGVPSLTKSMLDKVKIPIPSLPIQREIVQILDNFTELTAELTARRKQYNYYRDRLLTFDDDVPMVYFSEVCSLITKGTTPKSFENNGIAFIKTEAFDGANINKSKLAYISKSIHETTLKRSILQANDILFTIAGATIGKCAIVPQDILPANTNQALAIIRLTHKINRNFAFYLLQSKYMKNYMQLCIKGSAQPNLNLQQINEFIIPLPSLEEQTRIVDILDKFDALTNDITIGLPAEIAARRKQYEYYRDKLLTFKEAGA